MEEKKPDTVLGDGRQIYINKSAITRREWRYLFESDNDPQRDDKEDAILARMTSTTPEYIGSISLNDYQLILRAALERVNAPPDPNLPSVSILP